MNFRSILFSFFFGKTTWSSLRSSRFRAEPRIIVEQRKAGTKREQRKFFWSLDVVKSKTDELWRTVARPNMITFFGSKLILNRSVQG